MNTQVHAQSDPLRAPLRRRLLGLRVIAANAIVLVMAFYAVHWMDAAKIEMPEWVEFILMLPSLAAFFCFILTLSSAGADLVVHLLPDGKTKRMLLKGHRTSEQIAAEFHESGYTLALLPVYLALGIIALAVGVLLVVGGLAVVASTFNAVFGGWPIWAVVITVLLVLLLLKK